MNSYPEESPRELLLSRIVDRRDRPTDWRRFELLSDADSRLTQDLITALRTDATLRAAIGSAVDIADEVPLPAAASAAAAAPAPATPPAVHSGWATASLRQKASHWGGWMAAAVFLLCWMATDPSFKQSPADEGTPVAGASADAEGDRVTGTSHEAAATPAGSRDPELVRRLPDVLVETRPIPNSDRVEVVFVRRSVQRTVVSDLYSIRRDENGTPFEARVDLTRFSGRENY